MTTQELLQECKDTEWIIAVNGLRTINGQCPICYVAAKKSKLRYPNVAWDKAADVLGIPKSDASSIVVRSDNSPEELLDAISNA